MAPSADRERDTVFKLAEVVDAQGFAKSLRGSYGIAAATKYTHDYESSQKLRLGLYELCLSAGWDRSLTAACSRRS